MHTDHNRPRSTTLVGLLLLALSMPLVFAAVQAEAQTCTHYASPSGSGSPAPSGRPA